MNMPHSEPGIAGSALAFTHGGDPLLSDSWD
jgi:hypothetical protein